MSWPQSLSAGGAAVSALRCCAAIWVRRRHALRPLARPPAVLALLVRSTATLPAGCHFPQVRDGQYVVYPAFGQDDVNTIGSKTVLMGGKWGTWDDVRKFCDATRECEQQNCPRAGAAWGGHEGEGRC